MKATILFILVIVMNTSLHAQYELKEVTTNDSLHFEQQVLKSVDSLKIELAKGEYLSDEDKNLTIEFTLDTFRVSLRAGLYMSFDFSDYGMKMATLRMIDDYEILLNKYYKILLSKLEQNDRETLKISQRNWLKYRDSEYLLNELIAQDNYSGGGTIQNLFILSRKMEIIEQRVIDFYDYLKRISLDED